MKALYMILLLMSMATISSCNKDEGPDPCEGIEALEISCDSNYFWLLANSPRDTVYFKKYTKLKNDTTLVYQYNGLLPFYVSDSLIEKKEYASSSMCHNYYYKNEIVMKFLAEDIFSFNYRLIPNSFDGDDLIIEVKSGNESRYFGFVSTYYSKFSYYQSLNIGGVHYYHVNSRKGFKNRTTYEEDTDSTYAFFNRDHGLLKFIIKDSIVYERFIP